MLTLRLVEEKLARLGSRWARAAAVLLASCSSLAWAPMSAHAQGCSVTATADSMVCLGGKIHLGAVGSPAGGNYSWTGPNGFTSILQNPTINDARLRHAGKYAVIYDVGRCGASDTVMVAVDSLGCSIYRADSLPPLCGTSGNQLCVASNGAVSYAWSLLAADPGWALTGGQNTACVTYTAGSGGGATFQVVLTSASGCRDSCMFADSCAADSGWKVVVVSADSVVCPGGTIHLSATGSPPGGVYTWIGPNGFTSDHQSPSVHSVISASSGTYHVSYNPGPACPATPGYLTQWGSSGSANGQFDFPLADLCGIAKDGSGNVYVVDQGNARIQKFTSDGGYLTQWGHHGQGNGEFGTPSGIAVDAVGNVYVADAVYDRIQKFTSSGAYLTQWNAPGIGLLMPAGIAVDAAGNVYVADAGDAVILKFMSNGAYLTQWGTPGTGSGQFGQVVGVAVDAGGNVYVTDASNFRVEKFRSDGGYLTEWGSHGSGNGQFESGANGIAVDASGNVYVTDMGNSRVQKFSSSGAYLGQWGGYGSANGQFNLANGIAADACGNVYVADSRLDRIQKFVYGVCGCAPASSFLVQVPKVVIVPPGSLPRCGAGAYRLCLGVTPPRPIDPDFPTWQVLSADSGWTITGGQGTPCVTYTTGASDSALFKVVTTATGCLDSATYVVKCGTAVAVEASAPSRSVLYACSPNPFHTRTSIGFDLAKSGWVELGVYAVDGREVVRLVNHEFRAAGHHQVELPAEGLRPGMYFYRLKTQAFTSVRRMVLLR